MTAPEENNFEQKEGSPETSAYSPNYLAKISDFEGPLDILLHFVKEEELNIRDIPISKITKDFLAYINYMQKLDIELAGEFLLMASELMKIKARLLIPQVVEEGEEYEEDPRITLVRKLLEYKRFKDVTVELFELKNEADKLFTRTCFEFDNKEQVQQEDYSLKNVSIFNLIKAYKIAISNTKKEIIHPIELLNITPETQKDFILNIVNEKDSIEFSELIAPMVEKLRIICTFLSLLQLALEGYIEIVVESNNISKFYIKKKFTQQTSN